MFPLLTRTEKDQDSYVNLGGIMEIVSVEGVKKSDYIHTEHWDRGIHED